MNKVEPTPIRPVPGLQAQRTALSWTRVTLAFLANGALLLGRQGLSVTGPVRLTAIAAAFLLAIFAAIIAYRRRRQLAWQPLPDALAAPASLLGLGIGTMGLGVAVLILI